MKTNQILFKVVVAVGVGLFSLSGCSERGGNSNSQNTATNPNAFLNGGTCYSNTGQLMSGPYCNGMNGGMMGGGFNNGSNGQFQYYNGVCYHVPSQQRVQDGYCTNGGMMGGGFGAGGMGAGTNQCVGYFYYFNNGSYQMVMCNGADCRGHTLVSQQGQQVYCQ